MKKKTEKVKPNTKDPNNRICGHKKVLDAFNAGKTSVTLNRDEMEDLAYDHAVRMVAYPED